MIEADGWELSRQRGSHRQYAHPTKPGKITIAGHPNQAMPKGTAGKYPKLIREAIPFHLQGLREAGQGLREAGDPIPTPTAVGTTLVQVAA
jgi:predicted RNA binding protein YcfA (HicA-like mRNA interferase family)